MWSNPERGGKYECREFQFRLQKTACVEHLVQQLKAALHTPKSTRIQMAKVYGGKCDKLQGSLRYDPLLRLRHERVSPNPTQLALHVQCQAVRLPTA